MRVTLVTGGLGWVENKLGLTFDRNFESFFSSPGSLLDFNFKMFSITQKQKDTANHPSIQQALSAMPVFGRTPSSVRPSIDSNFFLSSTDRRTQRCSNYSVAVLFSAAVVVHAQKHLHRHHLAKHSEGTKPKLSPGVCERESSAQQSLTLQVFLPLLLSAASNVRSVDSPTAPDARSYRLLSAPSERS